MTSYSIAQPNELRFKHLAADDGLSDNRVYSGLQDDSGYIWIGTQNGLNRYDGYDFKVYKHQINNPRSIDNNWITDVFKDRDGTLWVSTSGGSVLNRGGLNRYDFNTDSFERINFSEKPEEIYVVWGIAEDLDNHLWIGTNKGLFKYNKDTGEASLFEHEAEIRTSLSDSYVNDVHVDKSGIVWVGTSDGGLNRYDAKNDAFYAYKSTINDPNSLPSNHITQIFEDYNGVLWVATSSGLRRYDEVSDTFYSFFIEPGDLGVLSEREVLTFFEDARNDLWIGSFGEGLVRLDRKTNTIEKHQNNPAKDESLSNDHISSIWEDHAGTLWIGADNGINFVDLSAGYFSHISYDLTLQNSLNDNAVKSIFADPVEKDILWVGTDTGGLNKINRANGHVAHYMYDPNRAGSIDQNRVNSLFIDHEGTLWAGTWRGINRFDRATGNFTHVLNTHQNLQFRRMRVIYEAPSEPGILWIASGAGGLVRYEVSTGNFNRFVHDPDDTYSISDSWVSAIYEDHQQQLWVGTASGGINKFDRQSGTFSRFTFDESLNRGLQSRNVNAIGEYPDGILWLATNDGLARFDTENIGFAYFNEQNSDLPNNSVFGLLVDDAGYIWMSSLAGLSKFDPRNEVFENYDIEQGLQGRSFNTFAYHKDQEGRLYFGGPNGLNTFLPDEIYGNPIPPRLLLTDFKVFEESVMANAEELSNQHISQIDQINLEYFQNDVTFEFVGFHFSNTAKNEYVFMLENYDRGWRIPGTQRTATYTSLNPGMYTFKVKASNSNGKWTEEAVSVNLQIGLPWWRKGWAYVLYVIAFGMLFWFTDRYQRSRLIKKEREAAHMREVQLRAEAAELKSQAAQSQARALEAENDRKEIELQKAAQLREAYGALQDSMDQLKKTQRQLVQAEKMASLGQLTAGIAHEIKNPLNFIINFASLSRNLVENLGEFFADEPAMIDAASRQEVDETLSLLLKNTERINEHGLRADSIVKNMMEHSRISDGELEETLLVPVLRQACDLTSHGQNQVEGVDINFEQHFDPTLGGVKLITQDFTRVIINLLENAFYAVREKAKTERDGYQPGVKLIAKAEKQHVVISIEDNGIGISSAVSSKIFEPFFTTKPAGSGNTGLGLSLSYDIISQGHQGTLEVKSKEGEGATFVITLPA